MAKKKQSRKELMEERKKKLAEKGGGAFKTFFVKDGTTRFRVPQIVETQEVACEVTLIFLNKELGAVISPATFGEPCAIMEKYHELKDSKDEDDVALAARIKPKKRYMMPVYRFEDEKGKKVDTENGVKLVTLVNSLYQTLCDFYLDDEKGDFADIDDGYDIKLTRSGKGQFDTEYSALDCKPTPLHKDYATELYNPEEMVRELVPTYEETEEMIDKYMGGTSASTDDEEDAPKKKSKKKKSKKKSDL